MCGRLIKADPCTQASDRVHRQWRIQLQLPRQREGQCEIRRFIRIHATIGGWQDPDDRERRPFQTHGPPGYIWRGPEFLPPNPVADDDDRFWVSGERCVS